MPGCNGQDTMKVRQGKPEEMISNRCSRESRWRSVRLVRPAVGNDQSARSNYSGPTGKRSAGKLACSVWSGGKTVRSYLSLQKGALYEFGESFWLSRANSLQVTIHRRL
jgi:hypothetical protein